MGSHAFARDPGEEHALDAMTRLTNLMNVLEVASERMVVRHVEVFMQQTTPTLSEVHLELRLLYCDLIGAVDHDWPGWKTEGDRPQLRV